MPKATEREMNILDFMGHQEQNLIGGIINLQGDLGFMTKLDGLYQYLIQWSGINKSSEVLLTALFLDVHKGYYNSMLNFLRNSFSVAMMSTRRSIDAGLTAYHLCLHPEDQPVFHDRSHKRYKKVFGSIKGYIKDRLKEYPAANGLVKVHELGSRWAAHATSEALLHRLEMKKPTKEEDGRLLLHYSEVMNYPEPYLGYYFYLIMIYSMIHVLFWKEFFEKKFQIKNLQYEKDLATFRERLKSACEKHPLGKFDEDEDGKES